MTSIRTMPIRTLLTIVGILAMMLMVLLSAPNSALAKDSKPNPPPDNTTQKGLEDQGYTCGGMGAYGLMCTKPGSPDYYCNRDGTNCQKGRITGKPTGGRPGSGLPHAGGNAGIAPTTHTPVGGAPTTHTPVGVAHGPTQSPKPPIHAQPQPPKPQSLETAPRQYNV